MFFILLLGACEGMIGERWYDFYFIFWGGGFRRIVCGLFLFVSTPLLQLRLGLYVCYEASPGFIGERLIFS